jgi:tetratricopeptide (TPR) repeat protein
VAGAELASALDASGDRPAATNMLRDLSTRPSTDVAMTMQLARLATDAAAFDVAQAFLDRAVALAPESAAIHEQSGQNLLALQRFDLAAAQFTEAVRLEPTRVDSLVRLAFAEFRLGRVADAQKNLATALAIDPKNATGLQVREMLQKIRH